MTIRFKMPIAYAIGPYVSGVGNIMPGSKLFFYDTDGATPREVYSDKDLSTAINQDDGIAANSAGRFPDIFLQSGLYKVVWKTAAGAEIDAWDHDDPGLATGGSGGILAVADGGTGSSTKGGALTNLGAAPQSGLDSEISSRQALDARVVVLETASAFITPGGRLTLTTATPVLSSNVTAAGTVYYTPYLHNRVPLWDGSQWTLTEVDEVSQALSDTTKSPAGAATDSAYDMFVWDDDGTVRCTRGPAWSDVNTRGTGAGTSELERIDGFWVNKQNITNGPAANTGLYVGTICTNGSTQLAMNFNPTAASGGTGNRLDVWNMYNRVGVTALNREAANSFTVNSSSSWESVNASTSNRVTFMRGMNEEDVYADAVFLALSGDGIDRWLGFGLDATDALADGCLPGGGDHAFNTNGQIKASYSGLPGLGQHFLQEIQWSDGSTTWYGDNNAPTKMQSGMILRTRM